MRETKWPASFNGRYEVPDGWGVYFIEIPCGRPLYKFPTIHSEHYANFAEITKWMYTNIRDVEETMWWDIDGDQMYFGFKHAADKTWFVMRWA